MLVRHKQPACHLGIANSSSEHTPPTQLPMCIAPTDALSMALAKASARASGFFSRLSMPASTWRAGWASATGWSCNRYRLQHHKESVNFAGATVATQTMCSLNACRGARNDVWHMSTSAHLPYTCTSMPSSCMSIACQTPACGQGQQRLKASRLTSCAQVSLLARHDECTAAHWQLGEAWCHHHCTGPAALVARRPALQMWIELRIERCNWWSR